MVFSYGVLIWCSHIVSSSSRPLQGLIEVASIVFVANQENGPQQRQIGFSGAEIRAIKPCPKLPSAATIDNQQNQRHQSAHKLFSSVGLFPLFY
jgi:hypothetical protein